MGTEDFVVDDDEFKGGTDDTFDVATQVDDAINNNGGNRRRMDVDDKSDYMVEGSALDIAVFHLVSATKQLRKTLSFDKIALERRAHVASISLLFTSQPSGCSNSRAGCDWIDLGIGARTADGALRYCCSNDAIDLGLCSGTTYGRMIMDSEKFAGKHRLVSIPSTGQYDNYLKYGNFEEKAGTSGKYAIIFANCNDQGRPVIAEGVTEWKSRYGYLPGDLFGLMYFFSGLFFVYFALLLWYGITMKMYEDANIPIQSWIFGTISMGCLELFFRGGDLFVWNEEGKRFWAAFYIGTS